MARPAIGLWQSANVVWQSSIGVWQSIIGVWQGTTGVWQSTTGVWRSTIGVWQSTIGVWQRSLAKCSAQGRILAGVLLTFSNLFAIPPGPPLAFEVANGAGGNLFNQGGRKSCQLATKCHQIPLPEAAMAFPAQGPAFWEFPKDCQSVPSAKAGFSGRFPVVKCQTRLFRPLSSG